MTEYVFDINMQTTVHEGLVRMYDRYMAASLAAKSNHLQPLMSYSDFVNQIIVRGMVSYAEPLEAIEKELSK